MKKSRGTAVNISYMVNIGLTAILFGLFLWRLIHTINVGDEVQNLTMAYRVVLGQRPWVDIWEIFQSGNSFASPAIWLYLKLTGSTDGIVLFIRLVYLLMNICLGWVLVVILGKYIPKKIVFACTEGIVFYAPFSLYYIWYDTMGLYFMLLGAILLFEGIHSKKAFSWYLLFGGFSHALMSYAYPSFVLLMIIYAGIIYFLQPEKALAIRHMLVYFLGASFIFIIFIVYIISVGIQDTIFVRRDILGLLISSHDVQEGSILKRALRLLWQPLKKMLWMILPTIVLLFFHFKNIDFSNNSNTLAVYSRKRLGLILLMLILLPFIALFKYGGVWATIYFTFYIFCWGPFLLPVICDTKMRYLLVELFYLMWIPCIFSYILVGFTSNNGGSKAPMGAFTGWIFSILLFSILVSYTTDNMDDSVISGGGGYKRKLIALCTVTLFITNTFIYGNTKDSVYRFQSGIFRGLYAKKEDIYLEEQEKHLEELVEEETSILCVGTDLLSVYLYTDSIPATFFFSWLPYVDRGGIQDWNPSEKYWKEVSGYPDLILISDNEEVSGSFMELLEASYTHSCHIENASVWKAK